MNSAMARAESWMLRAIIQVTRMHTAMPPARPVRNVASMWKYSSSGLKKIAM